jgi:hypothetical protein
MWHNNYCNWDYEDRNVLNNSAFIQHTHWTSFSVYLHLQSVRKDDSNVSRLVSRRLTVMPNLRRFPTRWRRKAKRIIKGVERLSQIYIADDFVHVVVRTVISRRLSNAGETCRYKYELLWIQSSKMFHDSIAISDWRQTFLNGNKYIWIAFSSKNNLSPTH